MGIQPIMSAMARRTTHMQPPAVDRRRPGLVWPVAIDPAGVHGPTPAQARGRTWWSPTRGLYLPAGLDPVLATDQRIVTAAALLPPGGAVTGWAALRWRGARYLDEPVPVTLAVSGGRIRSRAGIRVTEEQHLLRGAGDVDGLTVSSAAAATAYEVSHASSLAEAVALIDRVAAADLASLAELAEYSDAVLAGARWVSRLRTALEYADENCWSPTETTMRLVWRDLGITNVVCNRPVFDRAGSFVGTPDLLDLDSGLLGEYDGALHLAGRQRAKDIRREGAFRRTGLEYVEMVAADLADTSDFRRRTLEARARALATAGQRGWTIEPPPGWTPTHTVELRRALEPWERDRFLRWQVG